MSKKGLFLASMCDIERLKYLIAIKGENINLKNDMKFGVIFIY